MQDRRQFTGLVLNGLWITASIPLPAWSLDLGDATQGLKTALERAANQAIDGLGRTDGFLGNTKVRIPLPPWLDKASRLFKVAGQHQMLDDLTTAMNRAAESAVPAAKPLLLDAIRHMSWSDAQSLVRGHDTAATDFFSKHTRTPLGERFLPIVQEATTKVTLAQTYNKVVDRAQKLGISSQDQSDHVEKHVTHKALDGLFAMMGDEERKIRQDPAGTGSELLRKVFGR